jgi:hypothetical protein
VSSQKKRENSRSSYSEQLPPSYLVLLKTVLLVSAVIRPLLKFQVGKKVFYWLHFCERNVDSDHFTFSACSFTCEWCEVSLRHSSAPQTTSDEP